METAAAALQPGQAEHLYVLVVDGESSTRLDLPRAGTLTIGSAPGCEVCLRDPSAARNHAQIELSGGLATVRDLDSRTVTLLNNEPLRRPCSLRSGDVIAIGGTAIIFHGGQARGRGALVGVGGLRERIAAEAARSARFQRRLAVLCARFDQPPDDPDRLGDALLAALRVIDAAAWEGPDQILAVLPELAARSGAEAAIRLLGVLAAGGRLVRLGLAVCPEDGSDADTLLAGARAAAVAAAPGAVQSASGAASERALGGRRVLVADPAMIQLLALVEQLAVSDLPVLLEGETGVGKEMVAAALHGASPRADGPLVTLNCAALPDTLLESELFGHERGAFSGAVAAKPGLLERARGGTLFLDEVGELSAPAQAKLLRVLETRRVMRLGDVRERETDIRLVAATNRDLVAEVEAARFRRDLYFRLSGAAVRIPPLRDRPREIPLLARLFAEEVARRDRLPPAAITTAAMHRLAAHAWPGNVRELKHAIEFACAAARGRDLEAWHLPAQVAGPALEVAEADAAAGEPAPVRRFRPLAEEVRELEMTRMREALEAAGGVQTRAAALLGMPRRTFLTRLRQYQIGPPRGRGRR